MSKIFKCSICGSNRIGIKREVVMYQNVIIKHDGDIFYEELDDPIEEKFTAYVCGSCGGFISEDEKIITDEKGLKEYLEKYGVGAA